MPDQDEQASQPIGFPQSRFFKEQRAPTLPSPSEVRALNLQSGNDRANNFYRPSPVMVPAMGLLVKYGADVTRVELETQIWVREQLDGRVPIPEVFGWAEDGGQGFIYMALVDGKPLQELWGGMTEGQRFAICQDLREMAHAWKNLKPPTNEPYIGSLGDRRLNDIFFRCYPNMTGPFCGPDAVRQFQDVCGIEIPPADVAIAFTHNDLVAPNILLSPGPNPKVAAVIDWAQSGWYPAYWECCKAKRVRYPPKNSSDEVLQDEWAAKYVPLILDPVDDEKYYYPWIFFAVSKV
ncbi:hypothetical protein RB594_003245 [Gaeumannomyces avenae]